MDVDQLLVQTLNGVQYGLLLFLVASGLTLVFGIMGIINLAHGAFYMVGAYLAWWLAGLTGNLAVALISAVFIAIGFGFLVERLLIARLQERDHLDQVLLTYGLVLILDEAQRLLWGSDFHSIAVPVALSGSVTVGDNHAYPVYRLFITGVCLAVAAGLAAVIARTRLGMRIRAGASNRPMAQVMGIHIGRLLSMVFAIGVGLAAFAGAIAAPLSSVYPGMGERILILSFVVIVIGGVGSVKGAFLAALLIGLADTFGRVLLPEFSSGVIYALMVVVLLIRPHGLFGRQV
jgi:branched-chain amino acid transport system permease protein